jgi:hypothetical protein
MMNPLKGKTVSDPQTNVIQLQIMSADGKLNRQFNVTLKGDASNSLRRLRIIMPREFFQRLLDGLTHQLEYMSDDKVIYDSGFIGMEPLENETES